MKISPILLAIGALFVPVVASASADRFTSMLDRGPVIQNVTASSAVFMGRPIASLRDSKVTIEVLLPSGGIMSSRGRYDKITDSFEIKVSGLPTDTKLRYRIRIGDKTTPPVNFRTWPESSTGTVVFAAYGDTRTNPESHKLVADAIAAAGPLFSLCSGDLVADGRKADLWDSEFFQPAAELLAGTPVFPCLGNHEKNSIYYTRLFSLPGNEKWYQFKCGPVRVLTLNQYEDISPNSEQYKWMKDQLAKKFDGWTILQFHEPLFSSSASRGPNARWIETLAPVMEKYKVDIAVCGHDHHYVRTKPMSSKENGWATVHMVTGGGGAPFYDVNPAPFVEEFAKVFHYAIFTATKTNLSVKVNTPDGKEIDSFVLDRATPPAAMNYTPFYQAAKSTQRAVAPASNPPPPSCEAPRLEGIMIDGRDDDWAADGLTLPLVIPGEPGKTAVPFTNSPSLDAKVTLGWDSKNLLVLAKITDDVWYEYEDTNSLWKLDSIELFLSAAPGSGERVQWILSPGMATNQSALRFKMYDSRSKKSLKKIRADIAVARTVSGNSCTIEAALPWKAVGISPSSGTIAGFQIYVNDADNQDGTGIVHATWFPGTQAHVDTNQFGRIKLGK